MVIAGGDYAGDAEPRGAGEYAWLGGGMPELGVVCAADWASSLAALVDGPVAVACGVAYYAEG